MNWNQDTVVVNLYGGPGSGKSTLAAGLFHYLKQQGVNCELAHEWIKGKVWDDTFHSQPTYYVIAKQTRLIQSLLGKVDVVITDSPIFQCMAYIRHDDPLGYALEDFVAIAHDQLHSLDLFVDRNKEYIEAGRVQTEADARLLDDKIHQLLTVSFVEHTHVKSLEEAILAYTLRAKNAPIHNCPKGRV